jgi:predicted RNase H-related nuclease YkuK (DUF458 family)
MVLKNESKTERSFQMDLEIIRKTLNERPFRPIVFHLDNGEKQVVKHPEILVSEINVITLDDDGRPVFIKPEAITAIHYARNATAPRTPRSRKRATSRR